MAERWYAVQTHRHGESKAHAAIIRRGFTCFFPQVKIGKRIKPLFNGYVFVRFDAEDRAWLKLNFTPGVSWVMGSPTKTACGDRFVRRPCPVPIGVIEHLTELPVVVDVGCLTQLMERYDVGAPVHINGGSAVGYNGLCLEDGNIRCEILLAIMGKEVRMRVSKAHVERASQRLKVVRREEE